MLLTVFLIGLISGLVVLNIGQDDEDIARLEARRFAALVEHLQDESIIAGVPMGVVMSTIDNRYDFWELVDTWERVETVDVLREREVPSDVSLGMVLLQQGKQTEETESQEVAEDGERKVRKTKSAAKSPVGGTNRINQTVYCQFHCG